MKELSIEDKAKRYDEALKRAQAKMEEAKVFDYDDEQIAHTIRLTTTDIFPELKESEDERIRKWIIDVLSTYEHDRDLRNAAIAWLEKQGEQKPAIEMKTPEESLGIDSDTYNKIVNECVYGEQKSAWSEEDEARFESCIKVLQTSDGYDTINAKWLKSIKGRVQPKQEWSEEDIVAIDCAVEVLSKDLPSLAASIKRLKSLRPQNTWKPSDEQMKVLNEVINFAADHATSRWNDYIYRILKEFKEQLKVL